MLSYIYRMNKPRRRPSGGKNHPAKQSANMANFSWADAFAGASFPIDWLNTKGAGIRIALIDTGFSLPADLLDAARKKGKAFNVENPEATGDVDLTDTSANKEGHGTPCASIIAAKKLADAAGNTLTGLAPGADYLLIKAGANATWRHLLNGIQIAVEKKANLIVTGLGLTDDDSDDVTPAQVEAVFAKVRAAGIVVVATWPNAADTEPWKTALEGMWLPNRAEVVAAGRMPVLKMSERLPEVKKLPKIDVLMEGQAAGKVLTSSLAMVGIAKPSNSFAAYAVAGGLACMMSFFKKNPPPTGPIKWDRASAVAQFSKGCRAFSQATPSPTGMNFYRNQ